MHKMKVSSFSLIFMVGAVACYAGTLCSPEDIEAETMKKLATANNELAVNLYHQISTQTSENIFFSPLSLSTAFGMLYYGTKGNAAEELRSALGYEAADLPEGLVHQAFQHYLTKALPSQDTSAYVLNSANAALLDKRLDLISSYKTEVQNLYQATIKDVDFATDNDKIVQEINGWVRDKTNGMIDKLLEELDPTAVFVLLNAIYFKGTWKTKFEPSHTVLQKFYNSGLESEAKEVPMMKLTEHFLYTEYLNVQAVELPYKGENISMIVLLPKERDGLKTFEENLTMQTLAVIRYQFDNTEVHLTLPKFKMQFSREMSSDFESLGAKSIFLPGADFSGMVSDRNIFVSQILHKAVVEVNEEGSEAAGVTAVISNRMKPIFDYTPDVVVNHPFLFAIVDKRNDMILFVGRVTNL